jgi:hypothetical protein
MAKKNKDSKLDILNQTRDRTAMPRPVIFKSHKTYDRSAAKEEFREELREETDYE